MWVKVVVILQTLLLLGVVMKELDLPIPSAQAGSVPQYKVLSLMEFDIDKAGKFLNAAALEGWEFDGSIGTWMILKRAK